MGGDKFTDYGSALINNLNIASVDEAVTLIPSLKDKFPNTELLATRLAHLHDFQRASDDTNFGQTSYSTLSQSYHANDLKEDDDDEEQTTQSALQTPNTGTPHSESSSG